MVNSLVLLCARAHWHWVDRRAEPQQVTFDAALSSKISSPFPRIPARPAIGEVCASSLRESVHASEREQTWTATGRHGPAECEGLQS